jgi:hypothetical protein
MMEETKMFKQERNETQRQTVIAGLTRQIERFDDAKRVNLLNKRVSSSRSGDGGCSSAMTVKGSMLVNPSFLSLIGLLFVLSMSSCQTEKRLAKKYVAERPYIAAAVYFPEQAEVTVEYNAQLNKQTKVLQGFDQDMFLDVMYNAYAEAMDDYGVEVYVPEDADNVQVDSTHWLVMLSQMEIVGRITEYEDYLFSDMDEYIYKHPLNTVNVASWFEVNDGEWRPVLFCEHNLMDGFDSKTDFSIWTNTVDYSYSIDTLELQDVYNYAVYLGKLYAGYTYDYMMNSYIGEELLKKGFAYQIMLRYDPYEKRFRYAEEDDGFIEIE